MRTVVGLSSLVCVLHLTCHLLMGQHAPPWHKKRPPLWGKRLCSLQEPTAAPSFFFFPGSLSPACPSSPLLFTHRQLSQFPNAVIPSNILCSCFLLFSCSLAFLPLSLLLVGLFLGWGGRGWGRNREKEKKQVGGGVTFAALWLTTCVSGSLYLHVSHGKEGGGRGWRERKDEHMVLVCWVKFRAGLFVSCDERREIRSRNHLQIWLLPRAVVRLFLETGNVHKCTHKTLFSCTEIYMKTVFSCCMKTHCTFGPLKDIHSDWLKVLWSEHFYFLRIFKLSLARRLFPSVVHTPLLLFHSVRLGHLNCWHRPRHYKACMRTRTRYSAPPSFSSISEVCQPLPTWVGCCPIAL